VQVAFFPWLRLKEPIVLEPLTFVPFRDRNGRMHPTLADLETALNDIMSGYVDERGRPITNCVVVTHAQRTPQWDLADEDHDRVSRSAQILSVAAIAKNDYNTNIGCYANASVFQFFRQRFSIPVDYIAIGTRRRDGSTMDGGYRHGDIKFSVPLQANSFGHACVDIPLAEAILRASTAGSAVGSRILPALTFFNLANTDSDVMQQEAEIILMGSAFEQLLGVDASARAISQAVGDLLQHYGSITVAQAMTSRTSILVDAKWKAAQEAWYVHRKWTEEFYQLRNEYTHGGTVTWRSWGWYPLEHAVMAAFMFPLLLKLLLAKEGYYALTEEDEGGMATIDKLLAVTGWGQRVGPTSNNTGWQETLFGGKHDLALHRAVTRAVAELQQQGIMPPEPQNDTP